MSNLDRNTVIQKIKTRGYWKLVIEPVKPLTNFSEHISEAEGLLNEASIKLRGWNYPHIPNDGQENQKIEILNDRVNGFIYWDHFIESWTFFDSGQFVHILGLREDWFKESNWFEEGSRYRNIEPNTVLDFVGTTLTLTEMFLFIKNLVDTGKYGDSIRVIISLHNVQDRTLTTFDPRRIPMFFNYKATTKDIVAFEKIVSKYDLNGNYLEFAEKAAIHVFKFFHRFNPPIEVIKEDQKKLIERRL